MNDIKDSPRVVKRLMAKDGTILPAIVRDPVPDDYNFVLSTWLNSFRNGPQAGGVSTRDGYQVTVHRKDKGKKKGPVKTLALAVSDTVFFYEQKVLINTLLETCRVDIACDPEDENDIYGYLVWDIQDGQQIIHWVYVKSKWKNMGFAGALLKNRGFSSGVPCFYTHQPAHVFGPGRS